MKCWRVDIKAKGESDSVHVHVHQHVLRKKARETHHHRGSRQASAHTNASKNVCIQSVMLKTRWAWRGEEDHGVGKMILWGTEQPAEDVSVQLRSHAHRGTWSLTSPFCFGLRTSVWAASTASDYTPSKPVDVCALTCESARVSPHCQRLKINAPTTNTRTQHAQRLFTSKKSSSAPPLRRWLLRTRQ